MELLPCPFCGAQPRQAYIPEYYVECPSCRSQGPGGEKDTLESSVAKWNRRASLASVPEVTDAQIDRLLSVRVPGGSEARDWFLPHESEKGLANVRQVVRLMLAAAPTPPVSEDRWLPIETAPKYGRILAVMPSGAMSVIVWLEASHPDADGEGWYEHWQFDPVDPTHWMPLPKAPAMEGK